MGAFLLRQFLAAFRTVFIFFFHLDAAVRAVGSIGAVGIRSGRAAKALVKRIGFFFGIDDVIGGMAILGGGIFEVVNGRVDRNADKD